MGSRVAEQQDEGDCSKRASRDRVGYRMDEARWAWGARMV